MRRLLAAFGVIAFCAVSAGPAAAATVTPLAPFGETGNGAGQFRDVGDVEVVRDGGGVPNGALVVADSGNHRVQLISRAGVFQRLFGFGVVTGDPQYEICTLVPCARGVADSGTGALSSPIAATDAAAGTEIAVADTGNSRLATYAADGSSPADVSPGLSNPRGIAADGTGTYIADTSNGRIVATNPTRVIGSPGSGNGQLSFPEGLALSDTPAGGRIFVADTGNNRISVFNRTTGAFVATWGSLGTGAGQFAYPTGIALDASGFVYVTDSLNQRIQKFTSAGAFVSAWGFGVRTGNDSQFEVCLSGCYSGGTRDENEPFVTGQLRDPGGISVDSDGVVYVADTDNDRIQRFTQSAAMSVTPLSLEYGDVQLGNEVTKSVTVRNTGEAPLALSAPDISGPDAASWLAPVNGCPPALQPGATCTVGATFKPLATGAAQATLGINPVTVGVDPVDVPLSGGSGTPAASYSPESVDFGIFPEPPTPVPSQVVTVTSESQNFDLVVDGAQITGPDATAFTSTTNCSASNPLPDGDSCEVTVRFVPGGAGEFSANLVITSDAPEGTKAIPLAGSVRPPGLKLSPGFVNFPGTFPGESAFTQAVTVKSTGGTPLTIGGAAVSGSTSAQFPLIDECAGKTLARGETCTVLAGFAPTGSAGLRSGNLSVSSNAPGSAPSIPVMGAVFTPSTPVGPPIEPLGPVTAPPAVRIVKLNGKAPRFYFSTPTPVSAFRVQLDRRKPQTTGRIFKAPKRLKPGRHTLRVAAIGAGGATGPIAVAKFRVKKPK